MERDVAKEKRDAWERDVEKMRQIIAAQGCHSFLSLVFWQVLNIPLCLHATLPAAVCLNVA